MKTSIIVPGLTRLNQSDTDTNECDIDIERDKKRLPSKQITDQSKTNKRDSDPPKVHDLVVPFEKSGNVPMPHKVREKIKLPNKREGEKTGVKICDWFSIVPINSTGVFGCEVGQNGKSVLIK